MNPLLLYELINPIYDDYLNHRSLPGLIVTKVWRSFELPAFEQTNPYLPESECQLHQKIRGFWDVIAVRWWSEQAIVVVRRLVNLSLSSS